MITDATMALREVVEDGLMEETFRRVFNRLHFIYSYAHSSFVSDRITCPMCGVEVIENGKTLPAGSRLMLDRIDFPHTPRCAWVTAQKLLYPEVTHAIPDVPFNMYSCHARKEWGEGVMRPCARARGHDGPHLYHTRRGPVESTERDR